MSDNVATYLVQTLAGAGGKADLRRGRGQPQRHDRRVASPD